jgi:DNA-binding CsgD family transcriptional regulator
MILPAAEFSKSGRLARSAKRRAAIAPLTPRELHCLRWCKEGKTNWEIGEILKISEKTAEFHLRNAMRKLGAGNRITAVVIGLKRGLIPL